MFSDDPEIWYMSGVWAWLTVSVFFMVLMFFNDIFVSFMVGSAIALIIWILWPHLAFWIERYWHVGKNV